MGGGSGTCSYPYILFLSSSSREVHRSYSQLCSVMLQIVGELSMNLSNTTDSSKMTSLDMRVLPYIPSSLTMRIMYGGTRIVV